MPTIICAKCGGTTNTALCNHLFPIREDNQAHECYARWSTILRHWETGCAFAKADLSVRSIIQALLDEPERSL